MITIDIGDKEVNDFEKKLEKFIYFCYVLLFIQFILGTINFFYAVSMIRDDLNCGNEMYIWLIVNGGLYMITLYWFFYEKSLLKEEKEKLSYKILSISIFILRIIRNFSVIYACTIIFDNEVLTEFEECDSKGIKLLKTITIFSLIIFFISNILFCISFCIKKITEK